MSNLLITNPPRVVLFDPIHMRATHAWVFLGDVPRAVVRAIDDRTASVLSGFYGNNYKSKLGFDIKDPATAWLPTQPIPIVIAAAAEPADTGYAENTTFAYHGATYSLECALNACAQAPILYIPTIQLVANDTSAPASECDITAPLLVTEDDGRVVVLDGNARLAHAVRIGATLLPVRAISAADLAVCEVKSGGDSDADDKELEKLLSSRAPAAREVATASHKPGITYITDTHIFPEDKISEVKDKIHVVTGIPAYRQHLFVMSRGRVWVPYRIYADGIYGVNIRELANNSNNVLGLSIDKLLYALRALMRVDALDTFATVANVGAADNTFYIVDIAQFVKPIRTQLMEATADTYQFDLIYYGFAVKYWPQLTRECFKDYILSESDLGHKYPELAPTRAALESMQVAERDIIVTHYRSLTRAMAYATGADISMAITQMIATVIGPRVSINVRNLFDKLHVSKYIPEIHAYIEHEGRRYMLRKRHIRNESDIIFPSGTIMKNGVTLAISLRKQDQDSNHSRVSVSTLENEQSRYIFLNIWNNGKYHVKTMWNEEDELGFEDIIRTMKKFIDPIITEINKLGLYVFVIGTQLPLLTKDNVKYQGLNICIFWKRVMLANTFKVIRSLWDSYIKARIIGPRSAQQFDKYEFIFRKGMYEFDISALERIITASGNVVMTNQYAHLSNSTVKQKWDQNYDGRIVRMSHRTTDLRFEVADIRNEEYQTFYLYILTFIYHASIDPRVKAALADTRSHVQVKKLRKLREQDPELFNLKKYGSERTYSIICQNKHQPLIYTADELANMKPADVKRLTEYWNFTLNKPAWYSCPSREYPHLSFMVGIHPKHYCLPCCSKKSQTMAQSRKAKINAICAKKHKFLEEDAVDGGQVSRHIMAYGKSINRGRLSKLPAHTMRGLLVGTLDTTAAMAAPHAREHSRAYMNYYMYGVPQYVPGFNRAGIIYAIAEALSQSMEELVAKIIKMIKSAPVTLFHMLLGGTLIDHFESLAALIACMEDIFLRAKIFVSTTTKFTSWPELFTECVYILLGISVYTFIDETGEGVDVNLYVHDTVAAEILAAPDAAPDTARADNSVVGPHVVIMKVRNEFYPIFIINPEEYARGGVIASRSYHGDANIIKVAHAMVRYACAHTRTRVDLMTVLAYARTAGYTCIRKYINKMNKCYAVMLRAREDIYVPVIYSPYTADAIEISFELPDRTGIKLSAILAYLAAFGAATGTDVAPNTYYAYAGRPMAFRANNLLYYFDICGPSEVAAVVNILYDPADVNAAILRGQTTPAPDDPRMSRLGEALYTNYLYQLFIIEFVNYLSNERNTGMRAKLRELIEATDFTKDITEFRREIKAMMLSSSADQLVINNQIINFYHGGLNKSTLLDQINTTIYDFDRTTLNSLRALPRADMREALMAHTKNFAIEADFDTRGIKFPNIYMPCSTLSEQPGYCDGPRLMINRPMRELTDILAADLANDLRSRYLLSNVWVDTVVDFFNFESNPAEIVTIYKLTE